MQARYATSCAACGARVAVGEAIVRGPEGDGWVHEGCQGAPVAGKPARTAKAPRSKKDLGHDAGPVPEGTTEVFTDGACRGNPGPGGWAWAVDGGAQDSGHDPATTNQRMEILAALEAIRSLEGPLVVVSDSTYVVHCFRDRWWAGWRSRGWTTSAKKPVANRDLWEPLVDLVEERGDVTFRWVKGHSGHRMNDLVDQLAVEASHRVG